MTMKMAAKYVKLTVGMACVVGGLVVGGGVVTMSISPHSNGNTAWHPSSFISEKT